jgi:hypothetical protein
MTETQYVFVGIWPFIERAAHDLGCDLHQFGRTKSLWHVSQIQTGLGMVPTLDRAAQLERMEHVHRDRMSLATALVGVDLAIREVSAACNLPLPPYLSRKDEGGRMKDEESPKPSKHKEK